MSETSRLSPSSHRRRPIFARWKSSARLHAGCVCCPILPNHTSFVFALKPYPDLRRWAGTGWERRPRPTQSSSTRGFDQRHGPGIARIPRHARDATSLTPDRRRRPPDPQYQEQSRQAHHKVQ
ncbi:hypothetical protein C8R44DRAFT_859485 [Mycena epipterygia]|nr:hypothetical protein C8R44DRAFT_859485 [Mycena epipterygia]